MRVVFTLVLGLLACVGYSQTALLSPADQIAHLKEKGVQFTDFKPFTSISQLRNKTYSDICDDCNVMHFEQTAASRLLAQDADYLSMELPQKSGPALELELYRVDLFGGAFLVETSDGKILQENPSESHHYRGVIKGQQNSTVAVSVFEDQIMGVVSSADRGNWVLAAVEHKNNEYLFYEAADLADYRTFDCGTHDSFEPYTKEELDPHLQPRSSANACVKIYLEIDNDIFTDKGSDVQKTVDYILGIFNEVSVLYANEDIKIELSKVFIWTGESPYQASNSYDMLRQFQQYRTSIDGDLGQLLSYQATGGIAVVDGLCQKHTFNKLSFASIGRSYRSVPVYSYTVMVVAHELGHLFGSQHTHACVWNGNGTAIDGCAGFVEGDCAVPGLPSGGGTMMSYCHITNAGINFAMGFGTQPGQLMRNRVAGASCVEVCATPPDNGSDSGGGDDKDANVCVSVEVKFELDLFGSETSWEIRNEGGSLVKSGGDYENKKEGQTIMESICLPAGCYTLKVMDSDGDGMCCKYGNGSFKIADEKGAELASGSQFDFETTRNFCLTSTEDDNPPTDDEEEEEEPAGEDCVYIDMPSVNIIKHGGTQDGGRFQKLEGGQVLRVYNNAWKAIVLPYEVTPETVVRLEFKSERRPEVGGFGFEEDETISSNRTINLYGSQNWGIRNYKNYDGSGEWVTYEIPVGKHYTGQMKYFFFAADHDRYPKNGEAQFRNVVIYEGSPCTSNLANTIPGKPTLNVAPIAPVEESINVYPNPSQHELFFDIKGQKLNDGMINVFNMYGQRVKAAIVEEPGVVRIITTDLPNGTYLYRLSGFESEYTGKFSVHR